MNQNFKTQEEKLMHIGLACCIDLHDAFANLSSISSLCNDKSLSDKEKISLIKKKANDTYELFRKIERYRHQQETSETKTFLASDLATLTGKYFRHEGLAINIIKDFNITCKRTLLLQCLVNLVDNGYTHNSNDYDNKKVVLTVDENKIIVSDNGNGIPADNKTKIFDLFFTTKDLDKLSGENNGIGLYGVKQHIDNLGFHIDVENGTIMNGANFTIKI